MLAPRRGLLEVHERVLPIIGEHKDGVGVDLSDGKARGAHERAIAHSPTWCKVVNS